jgi:hypothetical protein
MPIHRFSNPAVKAAFEAYPQMLQAPLSELRGHILDVGRAMPGVGPVDEMLRWGQPAYRPRRPKTGTTIRIDALKSQSDGYALFVPCQTSLIAEFRGLYAKKFAFDGDRAIRFTAGDAVPVEPLKHCIALAFTYFARRGEMA